VAERLRVDAGILQADDAAIQPRAVSGEPLGEHLEAVLVAREGSGSRSFRGINPGVDTGYKRVGGDIDADEGAM